MVLSIGYGNAIMEDKIAVILPYGSTPLKTLVRELDKNLQVIDATKGKKTRTLIMLTSGQAVLCAVDAITLQQRFTVKKR